MAHPRPRWTTAGLRLTRPGWRRSISTRPSATRAGYRPLAQFLDAAAAVSSPHGGRAQPPVAMIELRNVGNSAPARDGAITTVPGPFLLHAVGLAADPSSRAAAEQGFKAVYTAAQPADVGLAAASFAEAAPRLSTHSNRWRSNGWLRCAWRSIPIGASLPHE